MKYIAFSIFLFFILPSGVLFAQEADSVIFYEPVEINKSDSALSGLPLVHDTLIMADTLPRKIDKKNWGHEIYQLISTSNNNSKQKEKDYEYDRMNYFNNYDGKIIRKISVVQLDVFGPTVFDTTAKPKFWFERLGNGLHISTNKFSIKNQLFLNENERISTYILADNERILRNLSNMQDARIYVIPIKNNPDSVDINIVTKDVWPIGFGIEILDYNYFNISSWNTNILGLGHILNLTGYYNFKTEPKYGYSARYRIPNLANMFVTLDLSHDDQWDYSGDKVYLSRNIITPMIRLGGGIGYEKVNQIRDIETPDSTMHDINSSFEYLDYWIGYAFPLSQPNDFKLKSSIFISFREQSYNFFTRPQVERDFLYPYHQRKIFLTSVGYAVQGYQNTRLIYGFGDTEDLPYGAMIKFTGGYERGEFFNRYYMGLSISVSKTMEKSGYLSSGIDFGGFYKDFAEQGVFSYNLLHISPLIGNKKHLFRNFALFQYEQGYNRYRDEFIKVDKNHGVRGLDYDTLKGDRRLFLNNEFVYYSPFHIYGFRFVFFSFIDVGFINWDEETLLKNKPYSSLGLGVRIRNEKLVFNTLQLRFCYFPYSGDVPTGDKQIWDASGAPKYRMPDFAKHRPEVIGY